jgi:flavin-dependent dehydrogenase
LKYENKGVSLNLMTDERSREVSVRYVVGADGARSRVAHDLKLEENSSWIVGCEEVYEGVRLDGPPCFHCFLDPVLAPGYLAWIVQDEGETHIGVGGYAARFDAAKALTVFRQTIAAKIIDLNNARQVARRGGRIPVGGVLRRIVNQSGLLTGDAAGAVSPLTAGGLDPCLRLSSLAATVIEDYLGTGDEAALAPYAGDQCRARFVSRLWMRRVIESVTDPFALEMICAALRLPLLRLVAAHVFFGRGSFPDVPARPSTSTVGIVPQQS